MSRKVKFPRKCTDEELAEIIARDTNFYIDFPYSKTENRVLTLVDYQEEQLRRKQKAEAAAEDDVSTYLVKFMDRVHFRAPVLSIALHAALATCKTTKDAAPLLFESANICQDFTSKLFMAHSAVRIAVKRLTRKTLVATSPENFWVLPDSIDAYGWVEKKTGFATTERIGRVYPRASIILEHLSKVANEKSERMATTNIDDPVSLSQLVDVLAVYPHYFPLEETHRVAFALANDKTVVARTVYSRLPEFQRLTSPEAQLEAWNAQM